MVPQIYNFVMHTLVNLSMGYQSRNYPCVDVYQYFSTMTSYEAVRGEIPSFKECEVKNVWMFIRNGASYPKAKKIILYSNMDAVRNEILTNFDQYQSSEICDSDIELFRSWQMKVSINESESLTTSGIDELKGIGERLMKYFSNLFEKNTTKIYVRITSQSITNQSANAVTTGIIGKETLDFKIDDQLLLNEDNCSSWQGSLKSDKLKEEVELLKNSSIMNSLISDVKRRMGEVRYPPFGEVKTMYELCGYETLWNMLARSPWCSTFTEEYSKVLEFYEDLTYYYQSGYGNPLTEKLGCEFIRDMVNQLAGEENITLNFGNSLGIRKLLVTLGIASKDPPLEGNSYENSTQREWKTSLLNPSAANIIAVLYNCTEGFSGMNETLRIAFYLNEKIVQLPICSGQTMCSYSEFIGLMSSKIEPAQCNRDFCNETYH